MDRQIKKLEGQLGLFSGLDVSVTSPSGYSPFPTYVRGNFPRKTNHICNFIFPLMRHSSMEDPGTVLCEQCESLILYTGLTIIHCHEHGNYFSFLSYNLTTTSY